MKNLSNLEFGKVFLNMTQKAQTGREKHISKFESIKTSAYLHFTSVCVLVTQLWLTLCDPMDYRLPGSSIHGILQARILGVGSHSLLQVEFLTQGSNQGLLNHRQILYCLSQPGKPLHLPTTWKINFVSLHLEYRYSQ